MRKRIHFDPQNISVRSYKITITSPSIVTLTNIQIQMTHPFLHRGLPISCSQRGIHCRNTGQYTHTHTRLFSSVDHVYFYNSSVLSLNFLQSFSSLFYLHLFFTFFSDSLSFSLSFISRKPHRMQSVSGAGMIGQWEAGCH